MLVTKLKKCSVKVQLSSEHELVMETLRFHWERRGETVKLWTMNRYRKHSRTYHGASSSAVHRWW